MLLLLKSKEFRHKMVLGPMGISLRTSGIPTFEIILSARELYPPSLSLVDASRNTPILNCSALPNMLLRLSFLRLFFHSLYIGSTPLQSLHLAHQDLIAKTHPFSPNFILIYRLLPNHVAPAPF